MTKQNLLLRIIILLLAAVGFRTILSSLLVNTKIVIPETLMWILGVGVSFVFAYHLYQDYRRFRK